VTYLILGAHTTGQHQHVTTVQAVKWLGDKSGYSPPEAIDCLEVAAKIRDHDRFFIAVPQDLGGGLHAAEVNVSQCRLCREPTIRTIGADSPRDNLDFMPCS
jgi:hypothetical protein